MLAWDAFEAPQFPFDEALRLARVVGLDLDKDVVGVLAEKKASVDLNAAKPLLDDNGLANSGDFLTALEAVLEVLPLSARYTGFDPVKAGAGGSELTIPQGGTIIGP